jgi:hypothetical protein
MKKALIFFLLISNLVWAVPIQQMNRALNAMTVLVPFIADKESFLQKKNEAIIMEQLNQIQATFKSVKHDPMIKNDIFSPSYKLIHQNLQESIKSFKTNKKDYAHWRLKELTSLCIDCHTRIPATKSSSFELGKLSINPKNFKTSYSFGIAQLIVRRYNDAKSSFTQAIDEKLIKGDFDDLIDPFKQILLIDAKVLKNPSDMSLYIQHYLTKEKIPLGVQTRLQAWEKHLRVWNSKKYPTNEFKTDEDVKAFLTRIAEPIKQKASFEDEFDVDMLMISGLLSNYLFTHPNTPLAPDLNYWIGFSEKYLKHENFFGSGDLFFKQCILKYPNHPMAKNCLQDYKESVTFEFSGSSGTHIPQEILSEIEQLETFIKINSSKK